MIKTIEENVKYETGVIHGRFQILHNDHLEYILSGKKLCLHLVISITNPDPTTVKEEEADSKRSSPLANPLTYYERYVLVRLALEGAGVKPEEYSVVPLPISTPELYKYYVPVDAVFFLSIYDDWGRRKKKYFESLGLNVHVLREVTPEEKGISAGYIRNCMVENRSWEKMVPADVVRKLKEWQIPDRLIQMMKQV